MRQQPEEQLEERARQDHFVSASLGTAGFPCASIFDFVERPTPSGAVPLLVQLLQTVDEPVIRDGVVRALCTRDARGQAEQPLIDLFRALEHGPGIESLKWSIGNTLEHLASADISKELIELATDRRHGAARQMIVLALGKLKNPRADAALIELLCDDEVALHAISAVRRKKMQQALPHLLALAQHSNTIVRRNALSAVKAIERKAVKPTAH